MFLKKITRKHLNKFLERHACDDRILDLGAGWSRYQTIFPNRVTVDIDPEKKPDVVGDAQNLPFSEGEFTQVNCIEMLEHVLDPQKAISEMYRVLKPGGKLLLTTRFIFPIHDGPHDYWRFTKYGLGHLFRDWDDVEIISETIGFETLAVLLQRMVFQLNINKFIKIIIIAIAAMLTKMNFLFTKEWGDITRKVRERGVLASGYYVVAKKAQ